MNSILCLEAFDIYTMASRAGINGRYHAAVAFHELLVEHIEKNVTTRVINYTHFEANKITYTRAKYLLTVAKAAHDTALSDKGQYGKFHICNSRPFSVKMEEKHFAKILKNLTRILDRDTLFSYEPDYFVERALHGRKTWTAHYDPLNIPKSSSVYIDAQMHQIDDLCNGKQIRVDSYMKLSNSNLHIIYSVR